MTTLASKLKSPPLPVVAETVATLREAIADRPKTALPTLFITAKGHTWETKTYGKAKTSRGDPLSLETAKLLKKLGLHRPGLGFYALRHTFQTIGEKSRDKAAVDSIMGHLRTDIGTVYNEESIEDSRLLAVSNFVHDWLFSSMPAGSGNGGTASPGLVDSGESQ